MCDIQGDNFGLLLGSVDFVLVVALSAWKGRNLAELADQLDTMVEHPNQSQLNHVTNQSFHPVYLQGSSYLLGQRFRACFVMELPPQMGEGENGRVCKFQKQSTQNL